MQIAVHQSRSTMHTGGGNQNPIISFFVFRKKPAHAKKSRKKKKEKQGKVYYSEIPSISRMITDISARLAASATRQKSSRKGAVAVGPPFPLIWWG